MKIKQISDTELQIDKSGWGGRIAGVFMIASLGLIPFALKSEQMIVLMIGIGVFTAVGIALLLLTNDAHIVLRRGGNCEVTKKRVLGGAHHTDSFDSQSIKCVKHEVSSDTNSNYDGDGTRNSRQGHVALLTHDGSTYELFSGNQNSGLSISGFGLNSFRKAPLLEEAEKIAGFLGVPVERQGEVTLVEAAQAVRSLFQGKPDAPPNTAAVTPSSAPAQTAPLPGPTVSSSAQAQEVTATQTPAQPALSPQVANLPQQPVPPVTPQPTQPPDQQ